MNNTTVNVDDKPPFYESREFQAVVDQLFEDLWRYFKTDQNVLQELYYNRANEIRQLEAFILDDVRTGDNLVVCGRAGTGKSNFIFRVLSNESFFKRAAIYPIFIDLHEIPEKFEEILNVFIQEMARYFEAIGQPIHGLGGRLESVQSDLTKIKRHLDLIPLEMLRLRAVILIDDMDYYEDRWYELLNVINDFAVSPKMSVMLAVRPILKNEIFGSFDSRIKKTYGKASIIDLPPLDVEAVLMSRLACLMKEDQKGGLFRRFFSPNNPLLKYLKHDISDFEKFELMLTNRFINFLRQITNGNIREIFDITRTFLPFVLRNQKNDALLREEEGKKAVIIDRKKIIDGLTATDSRYKLLDLHAYKSVGAKSKKGNSLLQNILEAVEIFKVTNEDFFEALEKMGHFKSDVLRGTELLTKAHLLETDFVDRTIKDNEIKHLALTDKGRYYLYGIMMWKEYIDRYGRSAKSLFAIHATNASDPIAFDILEFLLHARLVLPAGSREKFFISKAKFYKGFKDRYGLKYAEGAKGDNRFYIDEQLIHEYLTRYMLTRKDEMIVRNRKLDAVNQNKYCFLGPNIAKLAREMGLDTPRHELLLDKPFFKELMEIE